MEINNLNHILEMPECDCLSNKCGWSHVSFHCRTMTKKDDWPRVICVCHAHTVEQIRRTCHSHEVFHSINHSRACMHACMRTHVLAEAHKDSDYWEYC